MASREREERIPILLLMDEFQNFAGLETLGIMLAEGRKYRIQLALAHQHLGQLKEKEVSVEDVLSNTMTKVAFRMSGEGASVLAKSLDPSRARDWMDTLTSLSNGMMVVKLRAKFGEEPMPPFKISALPLAEKRFFDMSRLVEKSRKLYAAPALEEKIPPEIHDLLRVIEGLRKAGEEPIPSRTLEILKSERPAVTGSDLSQLLDRAESLGLIKRHIMKVPKGRPRVVISLAEPSELERKLWKGISLGGAKAGGDVHRALILNVARLYGQEGHGTEIPEQAGREEQPDLIVYPRGEFCGKPFVVEVETSAKHPDQVIKNYWKNASRGMQVIFVVPSGELKRKIEGILRRNGIEALVYVMSV